MRSIKIILPNFGYWIGFCHDVWCDVSRKVVSAMISKILVALIAVCCLVTVMFLYRWCKYYCVFPIEAPPAPAPIFRGSYALAQALSGLARMIWPGLNSHQFRSDMSRGHWGDSDPVCLWAGDILNEGDCYFVHTTGLQVRSSADCMTWSVDNIRSSHSVTLANRFIDNHAMMINRAQGTKTTIIFQRHASNFTPLGQGQHKGF